MPRCRRISAAVRRQITERDTQRCAYCRSPMIVGIPMVIAHIIPLVSGGSSTSDNLRLACYRCNEFKGSRTEAADPRDGQLTPFFHPRLQRWSEHFTWREPGDAIAGLTAYDRTTIAAWRLNNAGLCQHAGCGYWLGCTRPSNRKRHQFAPLPIYTGRHQWPYGRCSLTRVSFNSSVIAHVIAQIKIFCP